MDQPKIDLTTEQTRDEVADPRRPSDGKKSPKSNG